MKQITVGAIFLFLCWGMALADVPVIETGVYIYDGLNPLDKGKASVPAVTDWNNDGAKDLIIGAYTTTPNVWLFINAGTDLNPVFNGGYNIESGGVPITASWG